MKALTKENQKTIIINQESMKSKRVNLLYKLFSQGNPSQAISQSILVSEIPEISTNDQSCNAEFDLMHSPSGSTHVFLLWVFTCLVPARLSPRPSRSIDFGNVSQTNGSDHVTQNE